MCALHDFANERRRKISQIQDAAKQDESLARRDADYLGPVQLGIESHYAKLYESFDYYVASYPYLKDSEHAKAWWNVYRKRYEARKAQKKPCSDIFITKPIK